MIYAGYTPKKSSDEQYTPAYAVAPIIKYIPGNKIVWCPFDTEHSEYVLALKAAGIRVVPPISLPVRTSSFTSRKSGI